MDRYRYSPSGTIFVAKAEQNQNQNQHWYNCLDFTFCADLNANPTPPHFIVANDICELCLGGGGWGGAPW